MPGISGIVNHHVRLSNPAEMLKRFEDIHTLRNVNFIQRTLQLEHCVIANMLTGLLTTTLDQPAYDATGNTFLFLEGEIFDLEKLQGYVKEPREYSVCGILLAIFLKYGPDFASLPDGDFNIVIYQKAEKRLLILNDQLSSKPMYYMQEDKSLLFGSEKKAILAVAQTSPQIDPVGLLQVFAHRHNVNGRTFIKGLHCLPPSCHLEYKEDRLRLTRHAHLSFNVSRSVFKIDSLVETWCDHLTRATSQRLAGKKRILISLSGGLDSRAVACAIPRDLRPISARTRGYPDALEVIYATEIARRLDFDHFREDPDAVLLSQILPKIVWRTEGAIPFINGLTLANHAAIKAKADFLTGGWLGDAASGSHISAFMFLPGSRRQFIERVYRWYLLYSAATLSRVFNQQFLYENWPALKRAFLTSFEPLNAETNVQLFELWDLHERQTRMTLCAGPVDSHLFEYVRPLQDRAYLEFLLTLPVYLRYGQILYQAVIYRLGPEIRDIPNANTDLTLKRTIWGNVWNKGAMVEHKIGAKLLHKFVPSYRSKFGRAALGDLTSITRRDSELGHLIEAYVQSSSFDASIFNKVGILSMLDEHYRGVTSHANLLCLLATFVVSLSYFIYQKPRHCPAEAEPVSKVMNLTQGSDETPEVHL